MYCCEDYPGTRATICHTAASSILMCLSSISYWCVYLILWTVLCRSNSCFLIELSCHSFTGLVVFGVPLLCHRYVVDSNTMCWESGRMMPAQNVTTLRLGSEVIISETNEPGIEDCYVLFSGGRIRLQELQECTVWWIERYLRPKHSEKARRTLDRMYGA